MVSVDDAKLPDVVTVGPAVLPDQGPPYQVFPGRPHPLGATVDAGGVNFAIFSQHATAMELLLFDDHDDPDPVQIIPLTERYNKTFHVWHCYVKGLQPGNHYGLRVDGPKDVHTSGHRFNPNKVLLDPYAKGITSDLWVRGNGCGPNENLATSMRAAVIDVDNYNWEGDKPLNRPMRESVIYEMHVGGFTKSPTAGVENPGTFAGVIEKIPYLQKLGVTAIELLPVFAFDDKDFGKPSPITGEPLPNFWGYSTVGYFAPHHRYSSRPEEGSQINDFRDMVKALHRAGIEVILDVVFNHTSEGNHEGPTISFKGLDNSIYYHLVPDDKQYYMDYSGCGNTVNCNHPMVDKFIVECLEFWVQEMHVDGFRFDEGSILARGEDGAPMLYPPAIWHIELSEVLADTKIIAEAWDAAGLYQIGYFPGYRWSEWNGRFRDDVRRYVRGDAGMVGAVASRLSGSADLYQAYGHYPLNSVNFIACHDGFTMNDLVSYNQKNNYANGEDSRDGIDENLSWNCGVEGPTNDPAVEALRSRQVKNLVAILLLSQGVPMILGGDEIRRGQQGNNNAYCQDNEISWVDWTNEEKYADVFRFFQAMIDFRKRHPSVHRQRFFEGEVINTRDLKDIDWHGCKLYGPGFNDPDCHVLAFTMGGEDDEEDLHVMLNMSWEELEFEVPVVKGRRWFQAADTGLPAPGDAAEVGKEELVESATYRVGPHSVAILVSR
jgi:isoamylase